MVQLPLHQRLALIRAQKRCSDSEARRILFGPNGDPWEGAFIPEENSEVAKALDVLIEARQAASPSRIVSEAAEAEEGLVSLDEAQVTMCAHGVGIREFRCFDHLFGAESSQVSVFEGVAREQVAEFLNGLNACVLCYGQTGSGKTHTLSGPDEETSTSLNVTAESGIIPRVCHEVMVAMAHRESLGIFGELVMSYVEVYGEKVTNLLSDTAVGAWQGTAARAALEGSSGVKVDDMVMLEALLRKGEAAKKRAATAMNDRSSRSHTLLMLRLTQRAPFKRGSEDAGVTSQLCLADLGGSEQLKKSKATGDRQTEAVQINMGLLALKECIGALNSKRPYVPYQNSKLTMLLSGALGGDCKTAVIVTASLESAQASETMQALRFGEKCSAVETTARSGDSALATLLAAIDLEVAQCERRIEQKERWELVKTEVPRDAFGDGGGVVVQSLLGGAEAERARLEELLQRRRELTGDTEKRPGQANKDGMQKHMSSVAGPAPRKEATENVEANKAAGDGVEDGCEATAAPAKSLDVPLVTNQTKQPVVRRMPARLQARLACAQDKSRDRNTAQAEKMAARQAQAQKKRDEAKAAKAAKARAVVEKMTRPLRRGPAEELLEMQFPERNAVPPARVLHPTYENIDPDRPLPAPPLGYWTGDHAGDKNAANAAGLAALSRGRP